MASPPEDLYDFIIVGGGTAGLVLARRLTENPNVTVLVLEAGTDRTDDPRIKTPGLSSALYDQDEFDWKFKSPPQEHCFDKVISLPRGKTVGGSSAINILGIAYPGRSDIDNWAKLGNSKWTWDSLVPYYRKFQTYNAPSASSKEALGIDYIDDSIQGTDGPIQSSFTDFVGPVVKAWAATWKTLGWSVTGDPLSGKGVGGYSAPYSVNKNGVVRSHAGNEYYATVADRENLLLRTSAQVEKILFRSGSELRSANAVAYFTPDGTHKTVFASKEVILAAGTFHSPQILELSGIGNPDILQKHGIDVLIANPNVGENFQDHAMTGLCAQVADGIPTADMRRDPAFAAKAKEMYDTQQTGPLTAGFPSFAFLPLKGWADEFGLPEFPSSPLPGDTRPSASVQTEILADLTRNDGSVQLTMAPSQVHFDQSRYSDVFSVRDPSNFVAILISLPHPFSVGTCHIVSNNAADLPLVNPKFMSNPVDHDILGRHVLAVEKILQAEPLKSLLQENGKRLPEASPVFAAAGKGENGPEKRLDAGKEHGRRYIRSTSHPVGTCAMLPKELGGVVDERLKVYGVKGLRVVDASVMPMVPRGNIMSTVYAVAERAADLVKEDWEL